VSRVILSAGIRFTEASVAITLSATASDIELALPHDLRILRPLIRAKYVSSNRDSLNTRP
jgi:hypothetical protein